MIGNSIFRSKTNWPLEWMNENHVTMVAKSVGENKQVQMDEGGSNLQGHVLPKAKVGVSQDFSMQFERTHRIPGYGD
jgi:hypothetical protein